MAAERLKGLFTKSKAEPWRPYTDLKKGWSKEYDKDILKNIKNSTDAIMAKSYIDSDKVNIMLIGYIQSGKSSTINSIFSILDGRISNRSKSGDKQKSLTKKYMSYNLESELKHIVLFDTMGIELAPGDGVADADIKKGVKGHLEEGHEFGQDKTKDSLEESFRVNKREIHCVVYCVDAETIFQETIPGFTKRMQDVESNLEVHVQDRIVLVTKIDTICKETKKDIRKIFHSANVKKAVDKAASLFEVNLNHVFPVKNYVDEMEIDVFTNIPLLLALQKAVDFGLDYLRDKADKAIRTEPKTEV